MNFSLSKFIHVPAFIISVLIGFVVVYIAMEGEIRKIIVYPTPENIDAIQYKDNNENCFRFEQEEVKCSAAKQKMVVMPQ